MMQTTDPNSVHEDITEEPVVHDQLPSVEDARMMSGSIKNVREPQLTKAVPPGSSDYGHDQLPSVEEAKMNAKQAQQGSQDGSPKKRRIIWGAVALVAMTALVIGLAVGLSHKNTSSSPSSTTTEEPPTPYTYEEVVDFLVKEDISNVYHLHAIGSPQQLAATFMTESDFAAYPIPSSASASDAFPFLQRYALAVFFHALGGEEWDTDMNFVSGYPECQWNSQFLGSMGVYSLGVFCNETSGEVTALRISGNNLDGRIPSEISLLTSLTALGLHYNKITGGLPSALQSLTNLDWLTLKYNGLEGHIPSWIDKLDKLQVLALANNDLQGSIPSSLASLTALKMLALDDNLLTGDVSVVSALTNLEALYLEDNSFTGEINDSFLADLTELEHLDLSVNKFTGSVPAHLFNKKNLEVLDLHGNGLTGELPEFPENTMMNILALFDNEISGQIPDSIKNLKSLKHLDLASNKLTGDIVSGLGSLTYLSYLFLANNTFNAGVIPEFFKEFTKLEELSLKRTSRTGVIPDWIGSFEKLLLLDLDDNRLDGTIPASLGDSTNLRFLLLHRNELDGTVPTELQQLPALDMLRLESNNITGSTQLLGCNETTTISMFVTDCEVDCACCSSCCDKNGDGCIEDDFLANHDPIWEREYDREFFVFSEDTVFSQKELIPP